MRAKILAESPAHRLGQIIGYALELSVFPLLDNVANEFDLFVDSIGPRGIRGKRKLLTWKDEAGNNHNLDFVLERGGSDRVQGAPVAFIEVAWRRYTKHSVNKAGEIANALIPLRQTYAGTRPFLGAVVAGVWTQGGLTHMTSQGIKVLHIPMPEIVKAFADYGMDVDLGEGTPLEYLAEQVSVWESMRQHDRDGVAEALRRLSPEKYADFREQLEEHLMRQIERVIVMPLYGVSQAYPSPELAVEALRAHPEGYGRAPLVRFEIQIRYSNGDRIEARFENVLDAIEYLESHS